MGVDLGLEGFLGDHANDLLDLFAIFKEEHGRDGADAVFGGDGVVVIDVDLGNGHLTGELGGELGEDGSDGFAGAAPGGPEID